MLRGVIFWFLILLPAVIASAVCMMVAIAAYVIHITYDAGAFNKSNSVFQTLARDVYERQRAIWQAQNDCILFDEVLFYKPRPGTCIFNNVEYSTVLAFDGRGFRRSAPPSNGKVLSRRIVVLGDSQAMGWGVQDEETFASVLGAEHGFAVFNLGVASYGTARELLRLRREFTIQHGDILVIQYHPNDLQENLAFLNPGGLPIRSPADLGRLAHTAQNYGVLQVSASIGFILKGKIIEGLFNHTKEEAVSAEKHVEAFLSVIERFPELENVQLIVCEVDNFGRITPFPEILNRRSEGRITVLQPTWEAADFFRLDNHLNARGHRKLARLIASTVLSDVGYNKYMPARMGAAGRRE